MWIDSLLLEEHDTTSQAVKHEAPATGQSEEPAATTQAAIEMLQMLRNPVVPQSDLEIQLEHPEGAVDPMQSEDPTDVQDLMQTT